MWRMGLNPLLVPNGIPRELLRNADDGGAYTLRKALGADLVLCKVARWDPDKRWNMAIEAIAKLKEKGIKTVFLARGGVEPHGQEVLSNARSRGRTVREVRMEQGPSAGYLETLQKAPPADVLDIKFHIPLNSLRVIYKAAD